MAKGIQTNRKFFESGYHLMPRDGRSTRGGFTWCKVTDDGDLREWRMDLRRSRCRRCYLRHRIDKPSDWLVTVAVEPKPTPIGAKDCWATAQAGSQRWTIDITVTTRGTGNITSRQLDIDQAKALRDSLTEQIRRAEIGLRQDRVNNFLGEQREVRILNPHEFQVRGSDRKHAERVARRVDTFFRGAGVMFDRSPGGNAPKEGVWIIRFVINPLDC